jgi:type VI secretion system ImpM family protein
LGKLPGHGDFLKCNAAHEELRWIDGWIRQGIASSYQSLGPRWTREFDRAHPARLFAYRPGTGRVLCARIEPARDSVGRRYPFIMFHMERPPSKGSRLAQFVPAFEPFFGKARDVAVRGGQPGSRGEFLKHVETLNHGSHPLWEPGRFDHWLENQTVGDLFGRSFGDARDPRKFSLVGKVLAAARAPYAQGFALRLPEMSRTGDVAFWLALIEAKRRAMGVPYTLLWSRPLHGSPTPPVLFFGEPRPEHFMLFIDPSHSGSSIRETAPAGKSSYIEMEGLRMNLEHLLDDEGLPLRLLLEYLCMLEARFPLGHLGRLACVA